MKLFKQKENNLSVRSISITDETVSEFIHQHKKWLIRICNKEIKKSNTDFTGLARTPWPWLSGARVQSGELGQFLSHFPTKSEYAERILANIDRFKNIKKRLRWRKVLTVNEVNLLLYLSQKLDTVQIENQEDHDGKSTNFF